MVDKLIATINVRNDDDVISSHVEVVDTQDKYGDPIRVREFIHGVPHGFYRTWHFDNRIEAMSFSLALVGFGPLADNDSGND